MLTFDNTIQTVKDKLEARKDVLKILQKTPFWSIIKAYMAGQFTKTECQKSNYEIVRLIRLYNPATKKFKFSEGNEYEITSNDVSDIFGLPNKGNKLPSTTTSTRTNLDFEEKYFKNSKKITKTEVDRSLNTAIADDRNKNAMDVVRLLILELFITNLFCNSGATMAWTFLTMIDTLKAMNSYNWAQGVLDYMHFGLDQAMKNKKDKTNQPSVSGCLVLILYWLCERTNLISPIPGREDHKPAAVKWSLPELNIKLNTAKYENIKIKAAGNEKEEEATKADHADHEEQEENEEDDDFVMTLKDWEENEDNAQSLGCKADDEIEEQAVDLSADTMTEVTTVNVRQQDPELHSQEDNFDNIFDDMVGSIPEYYKHEIVPPHEKIQELKEAVDYWIEKADTRKDMMQTAIESCIKKNTFIHQIWAEKEDLEQQIEILKKQLDQEQKESRKLQGELHALKSNRRQLQEQREILEGEKLSCIESMKEKDTVIASLKHMMGQNLKQGEQGEIPMKEQADKEKKDERIAEERDDNKAVEGETSREKIEQKIEKPAENLERTDGKDNQKDDNTMEEEKEESELEMQESPDDEDENADEKTPEKSVIMQAKEVGKRQLRSGIKIIKDRKDRKPAKKEDYTYPEAHKKARKRASQSEDEAANKKKDKDAYLQLHMYGVFNRLDEISKKKLENYWKTASDSDEDAFYLNNRTILYKHNIEKLIGDYPISALIIDAYGEALNDDAKQNTQKQKNAYLSADNYMFLRGASYKLTYDAFYMPLLENIGRVDRVFIPITDENHHTLLVFDTGAATWTHFNSFRPSEKTVEYYHKKAIVLVEIANIFLCLLKECAATSLKTKLISIPDFDAKKPRGLNEASAKMIAKILASIKLTPEYTRTLKYLIRQKTTNFKLTENRECPQQANNS
ncbi:hypothetical protein ACE6H2_012095 [Prunus campanulata]